MFFPRNIILKLSKALLLQFYLFPNLKGLISAEAVRFCSGSVHVLLILAFFHFVGNLPVMAV